MQRRPSRRSVGLAAAGACVGSARGSAGVYIHQEFAAAAGESAFHFDLVNLKLEMAATEIAEKREDEGAPPAPSAAQPAEVSSCKFAAAAPSALLQPFAYF